MSSQILEIPVERIVVANRLRAVDADYVQLLAASMAETGQHTPIQVGPADAEGRHRLIAGAHRHSAALVAGLPSLQAIVFTGSELEARMLEVDENLLRRELSELDRAVFLAERKAIYEALFPETGHGKAPKGKEEENFHFPGRESFADETAKKLGVSGRQVRTYLMRARIEPELRARLAVSRWADHGATLDALAKAAPATRAKLVAALTREEEPARNIAAALAEVEPRLNPARSADDEHLARLMTAWRKAPKRARDMFLGHILSSDGPAQMLAVELLEGKLSDEDRIIGAIGARAA
jgi:ParB family transcriptional regulator, chromosome partitioning protein